MAAHETVSFEPKQNVGDLGWSREGQLVVDGVDASRRKAPVLPSAFRDAAQDQHLVLGRHLLDEERDRGQRRHLVAPQGADVRLTGLGDLEPVAHLEGALGPHAVLQALGGVGHLDALLEEQLVRLCS